MNQYISSSTMVHNYLDSFIQNFGLQHIAIKVFSYLDFETLQNSKLVSKEWNEFIEDTKPIWISNLRSLKFRIIKNWFEFRRLDDQNPYLHIYLEEKSDKKFGKIFPAWLKIVKHFETRSIWDVKIFLNHMFEYLKIDWDSKELKNLMVKNREFTQPCDPAFYAVLTKNTVFLQVLFKGPFELSLNGGKSIGDQNLAQNPNSLFQFAIRKGYCVLQQLIIHFTKLKSTSFDVNIMDDIGRTALSWACIIGNLEVIELLCSTQPSINVNIKDQSDYSPLELALVSPFITETTRKSVIKILCGHPDINVANAPLIACNLDGATKMEICEIVEILIKSETADLNSITDMDGWTCLHYACLNQNVKLVQMLCQHPSINVNAKTKWGGETPLHKACQQENAQIVEILFKHPDIDIQAQDSYGQTPYHISVRLQDWETTQFFLDQRKRRVKNIKNEENQKKRRKIETISVEIVNKDS